MYFENDKDNRFWLEKFEDIQARNVKNVMFLITPQNKNIERCVKIVYNNIRIVESPDDMTKSITKFLSYDTFSKVFNGLKTLFFCDNKEIFAEEIKAFEDTHTDKKLIVKLLEKNKNRIMELYSYSKELRTLFYPYYAIRDMKQYLNKLNTKEPLCSNINEIIDFCIPMISSFEVGRTYNKKEWLNLINAIYEEYEEELEEYINE